MLTHFRERQRAFIGLPGLPILAAVAEGVVALTMAAPLVVHLMQSAIVIAFVAVGVSVREMSIQVDGEHLRFGFGPIRTRILLANIVGVKVVDSSAQRLGLGVRSTHDGRMAWIAARGTAVEVEVSRQGPGRPSSYVISTARPHDLAAALQSGKTSRTLDGA